MNRTSLGPLTLEGDHIRLSPLSHEHLRGLLVAAQAQNIWTYLCLVMRPLLAADQSFVLSAVVPRLVEYFRQPPYLDGFLAMLGDKDVETGLLALIGTRLGLSAPVGKRLR